MGTLLWDDDDKENRLPKQFGILSYKETWNNKTAVVDLSGKGVSTAKYAQGIS